MTPREFAGAINRCKTIYVYVPYGVSVAACEGQEETEGEGMFLAVPRTVARLITADAKEQGTDVEAFERGSELFVGAEPG